MPGRGGQSHFLGYFLRSEQIVFLDEIQDVDIEGIDRWKRVHYCGISAFVRHFCSISLCGRAGPAHSRARVLGYCIGNVRPSDHRRRSSAPSRLAAGAHAQWFASFRVGNRLNFGPALTTYMQSQLDPSVTWKDIDWVRSQWLNLASNSPPFEGHAHERSETRHESAHEPGRGPRRDDLSVRSGR